MRAFLACISLLFVITFSGCPDSRGTRTAPVDPPGLVDVVARGLEFEAPREIPPGWTTFRLRNASPMTHFALLERLPEGIRIGDQQEQVAPLFQEGMNLLNAGEAERAQQKFGELPEWFGRLIFLSGPGLVSPGRTAETTVYLEPGVYLLECYVKTGGIFHSYNPSPTSYGMVHELVVTGEVSGAPEPEATVEVTISSERGIEASGVLPPGDHVVAVRFEDQKLHENFVGHDVHVVRLDDATDLEQLSRWVDWMQPEGLETPAPAEFLGGTHEMPAGGTAYVHVRLEPGRYAWIAEVTNPREKGMLKTFTVRAGAGR